MKQPDPQLRSSFMMVLAIHVAAWSVVTAIEGLRPGRISGAIHPGWLWLVSLGLSILALRSGSRQK